MSKYEPLAAFLAGHYGDEVPLRFADIERVLGFALPPSARRHRPFWSNNAVNSAMTKVWREAGFRTERVDMSSETLVFVRTPEEAAMTTLTGFGEKPQPDLVSSGAVGVFARHPAIGALKGMITFMPGVDLTAPVDPEWIERLYDEKATAGDLVGGLDDPVRDDR